MMTRNARFAVIAIAVVLLVWTAFKQTYEITAIVALGISYLIWSHIRQGSVALAAKAYHNSDFLQAEVLLNEVRNPDRLSRKRRGFYEFMYGNIELKRDNFDEAERHFQIATKFPVRNENDKAIILVQLANLNLRKKDYEKAGAYVERAKTLKISSRVQSIIQKIEKEIPKK